MNSNGTRRICCPINKSERLEKERQEFEQNPQVKIESTHTQSIATMSAADNGRELEVIIYNASLHIPDLTKSLREYNIRTHFGDTSLNGVDHMISIGTTHCLIQDKWKETIDQQEVSQFILCAQRIKNRIPNDKVFLIWASKKAPTANSKAILDEANVQIVTCGIDLQSLALCVILQVCKFFGKDSTRALQSIKRQVNVEETVKELVKEVINPELEQEARELLKIRKEIAEKKRIEEEEKNKELNHIKSLLETEVLLCHKTQALPNTLSIIEKLQSYRYGIWNPSEVGKSPKEMLEYYNEIVQYKENCVPELKRRIEEFITIRINDLNDTAIKNAANGNQFAYPHDALTSIKQIMSGTNGTDGIRDGFTDINYWKWELLDTLIRPIFNEEWNKLHWFCKVLYEKNKNKPSLDEAISKIRSMEQELPKLKERNDLLEEKLQIVRQAVYHLVPT
jgi:hypothetical protein